MAGRLRLNRNLKYQTRKLSASETKRSTRRCTPSAFFQGNKSWPRSTGIRTRLRVCVRMHKRYDVNAKRENRAFRKKENKGPKTRRHSQRRKHNVARSKAAHRIGTERKRTLMFARNQNQNWLRDLNSDVASNLLSNIYIYIFNIIHR